MQMADFYMGAQVKRKKLKAIYVLGDAEYPVETRLCNNFDKFHRGKQLFEHIQSLPLLKDTFSSTMAAGCYHMDSEMNNSEITFFPGHVDKSFVHTVWFVPLGMTPFFTILSVSRSSGHVQDTNSIHQFEEWKNGLSDSESKKVDAFLHEFDVQAQKHLRDCEPLRLIYLNIRGSVLSFPANTCYHATITPKKPSGYPRDLFVFHPLDGQG